MSTEREGRTNRDATTLRQLSEYSHLGVGPAGAVGFERQLMDNIRSRGHASGAFDRNMIDPARRSIGAYQELFRRPSELDSTYRNALLSTLNELEHKLNRLERSYDVVAADSWLRDYLSFNSQIGSFASEAKKDEATIDRIVRGLRTFSKVTLAAFVPAALVNPGAALIIGATGVIARAAASSLQSVWQERREESLKLQAGGGRWATAISYTKQLLKGTLAAYEETEGGISKG